MNTLEAWKEFDELMLELINSRLNMEKLERVKVLWAWLRESVDFTK